MSWEATSAVINLPFGGNAKVIILGLANHAHPDGTEARPAIDTLTSYAHCDRRTVQRQLRTLQDDGWIRQTGWHEVNGRADRKVAVYRVTMTGEPFSGRQDDTPPDDPTGRHSATPPRGGKNAPRGDTDAERGGTGVANGAALAPPEPSIGTTQEPSENNTGASAGSSGPDSGDVERIEKFLTLHGRLIQQRTGTTPARTEPARASARRIIGKANGDSALILSRLEWALGHGYWAGKVSTMAKFDRNWADLSLQHQATVARDAQPRGRPGAAPAATRQSTQRLDMYARDRRAIELWESTGTVPAGYTVEELTDLRDRKPWENEH